MKRRGETRQTDISVFDLLEKTPYNIDSAAKIINLALCYVTGVECKRDFTKALRLVEGIETDLTEVISWWSDEDIVGRAGSNMVLLLLELAGFIPCNSSDSINKRFKQVRDDVYALPDGFKYDR